MIWLSNVLQAWLANATKMSVKEVLTTLIKVQSEVCKKALPDIESTVWSKICRVLNVQRVNWENWIQLSSYLWNQMTIMHYWISIS